jgi:hypothetical protein
VLDHVGMETENFIEGYGFLDHLNVHFAPIVVP